MLEHDLDHAPRRSEARPPARKRLRLPLGKIDDVARELARLYRAARAGEMETSDASRLANILQILSRVLEGSDLEKRIEAIEKQQGAQGWDARH